MQLHDDMTPEEIRAARRGPLNEWRALHGVPPVRSWHDALTDPFWVSVAWVAAFLLLPHLGVSGWWAILAPFAVLLVWVHGYRAFRRRQDRASATERDGGGDQ